MNILQKVKQVLEKSPTFEGNYYDAFYDYASELNLPQAKVEVGEDEFEYEDLNFENFAFSKVNENEIIFCAGGDWQNPLMITLKLDSNSEIIIAEHEEGFEDNYQIKFDDIIKNA